MSGPACGTTHAARAVALSVAVLGLSAAAHVAAGSPLPAAGPLLVLALATGYACAWATRVRLPHAAVLALLGTGQLALHQAFGALATAPECVPGHDPHAGHEGLVAACSAAAHTGMSAGAGSGVLMLAAHAAATLVTGLLVATGEAAVWALCGWLRPRPALPAATAAVPPARRVGWVPSAAPAGPAARALLRVAPRRGPPAGLPAA